MEFEFEEVNEDEISNLSFDDDGYELPEKNNLVALIDADTLIFSACLHCEYIEELLPKEMYSEDEWSNLSAMEGFNIETNTIACINITEAFNYAKEKLQKVLDRTGCLTYELHFTAGRQSFRYTQVWDQYKQNRVIDTSKRPPAGLMELKQLFADTDNGEIHYDWEADDIVVMKKKQWPDKYLLVALDKDVLYSLPGTHFNYYESIKYSIKMKFFDVTEETAMKHHYIQTLTGDSGDNVPGLHRVGKKTADKILKNCKTLPECWDTVVKEYENRGKTVIDAILSMRLVHMQQLELIDNEWRVKLWKPE